MEQNNEIVLFETSDKEVTLSVPMDGDTVWLTQEQMSSLFATARLSIAYHIGNIFKEGELEKDTSVEIFDRSAKNAHCKCGSTSPVLFIRCHYICRLSR